MDTIGLVSAGIVLVALLAYSVLREGPRGTRSFGSEGRLVWLAAAVLYAVGVLFIANWWWAALPVAALGALGIARLESGRWGRVTVLATIGALAFSGLCLVGWWVVGVAIGVLALGVLVWVARNSFDVATSLSAQATIIVPSAATIGLVTALPHRSAGLLVCGLAAAALAAFVLAVGIDRWGWLLALGIAAVLLAGPLLVWLDLERSLVELVVIGAAILALVPALMGAFREAVGPFDTPSADSKHPCTGTGFEWVWVGAVTEDSATITARLKEDVRLDPDGFRVPDGASFEIVEKRAPSEADPVVFDAERIELTGLPSGECPVTLATHGDHPALDLRFSTFPYARQPITIAASSCASIGSDAGVFDRIVDTSPDVFLHLGDLHYENIAENDKQAFHGAYDTALRRPAQGRLFSKIPTVHTFDDHDYGPNNSDSSSPSREASLAAYREVEPHYALSDREAVYQKFRIGPVLVLVTDTRSERTPHRAAIGRDERRIMSQRQQDWLLDEVWAASHDDDIELVVWACSTPWIGFGNDPDIWEGFAEQRREIYEELRRIGQKLVFVAGDAHMIGIDDGTNSGPRPGDRGFPVLAAASLDRRSSQKGSPPPAERLRDRLRRGRKSFWRYPGQDSKVKNPSPGYGQFGTITVSPVGDHGWSVTLRTHDRHGETPHEYTVGRDAWLGRAEPPTAEEAQEAKLHGRAAQRMEHLVVLMLENRSFDHLFGFDDFGDGSRPLSLPGEPNYPYENELPGGKTVLPTNNADYGVHAELPHSYRRISEQIHGGRMDGFAKSLYEELAVERDLPHKRFGLIWLVGAVVLGVLFGASVVLAEWHQLAGLAWTVMLLAIGCIALVKVPDEIMRVVGPQWRSRIDAVLLGSVVVAVAVVTILQAFSLRVGLAVVGTIVVLWSLGVLAWWFKDRRDSRPEMKGEPEKAAAAAEEVMQCMPTGNKPVLDTLAKNFALCTRWFSSVPGATWPNRNFLHAGTSDGTVDIEIGLYDSPTVFERLEASAKSWRIYYDGGVPQVIAFRNLWDDADSKANWFTFRDEHGQSIFEEHVENDCLPTYTFIEPRHNGDGELRNSQHPGNNMIPPGSRLGRANSDFGRGEELIAEIYETLRAHPEVFKKTVFVITYDEHGGYFDRQSPPRAVAPDPLRPADVHWTRRLIRKFVDWGDPGFSFDELGVRVPTIVVSPWIDSQIFGQQSDHTSVITALRYLWGFRPLGARDHSADPTTTFASLVTQREDGPRTDLPSLQERPPDPEVIGGSELESRSLDADDGAVVAPETLESEVLVERALEPKPDMLTEQLGMVEFLVDRELESSNGHAANGRAIETERRVDGPAAEAAAAPETAESVESEPEWVAASADEAVASPAPTAAANEPSVVAEPPHDTMSRFAAQAAEARQTLASR